VAYFQQGVSNFLLGDFEEALANFNDTLLYLRGNTLIDYSQLGLLFKLYSCEVLFNRGLCYIYLEQMEAGMQDLQYAVKEKVVEDHNVIDDAIRDEAKVRFFWACGLPCSWLTYSFAGLHRLLDSRRRRLQAKRGQGAELAAEGLPRKGAACCGIRS
jgi:tetratricopeptide (TPR) repeat protein